MPALDVSPLEVVIGNILFWLAIGAFSSCFLVTTDRHDPEIRKAGFVYLLIAHRGAIGILPCFCTLFALMPHNLKRPLTS